MARTSWSIEDDEFLRKNYKYGNIDYCASKLGRTRQAIMARSSRIGVSSGRYLSKEEHEYIESKSYMTNESIAKKLNRSSDCIKQIRYERDIGTILECNDRLTMAEIGRLVGKHKTTIQKVWVDKRKMKSRKVGKYRMIKTKDLFDFMQNNTDIWDATKCEKWFFQSYPWYQEKRKEDLKKLDQKRWGNYYSV